MARPRSDRLRSALVLLAFLAITAAIATLGGLVTSAQVDGWYEEADKVPWTPPGALFGPVWTVLYALMSVAAWLVWRERERTDVRAPLALYVAQLVLNALWTPVFFGAYPLIGVSALWIAAVIIVLLDALVLATILAFWRVRPAAGALLIPYLAWILYATTLNVGIAVLQS